MIKKIIVLSLAALVTMIYSCDSYDPGPLAAGNSRIEIKCYGWGDAYFKAVAVGESSPRAESDFSWIIADTTNLDVPVPPNTYDLRVGSTSWKTVSFTSAGETQKFTYWAFFVSSGEQTF